MYYDHHGPGLKVAKLNNKNKIKKYEVNRILDSRINRHCKGTGLLYLVEWKGFGNSSESTSWEPVAHMQNTTELVEAFHQAYPDKPKPL